MVYGYIDSAEVRQLSRMVFEYETPEPVDRTPVPGVDYAHFEAHPLALELAAKHGLDGVDAALAYLAEGSESDVPAVIRWMIAGGYQGRFETDAAFAADYYGSSLDDYVEAGLEIGEVEFPPGLTLSDFVDWEDVAYEAIEIEELFYSVVVNAGVYIFDISIDIDHYRE